MALTLVFAVLAGAGTALSPCVLPVLPVALAAGATGGRRRPLGVAVGLAGFLASLLGRRRASAWVTEGYRPEGQRRATWGLALSAVGTVITLLLEGFVR